MLFRNIFVEEENSLHVWCLILTLMHSVFEPTVLPNLEFPMCITTRRKNGPVTSPWVTRATNQINVFIKFLLSLPSTQKTPRQVPFCKPVGVNATWKAFLVPLSLVMLAHSLARVTLTCLLMKIFIYPVS